MNSVSDSSGTPRLRRSRVEEETAGRIYVARQLVPKWEQGKPRQEADGLIKIADALSTDAAVLLYGEPDSGTPKREKIRLAIAAGITLALGIGAFFLSRMTQTQNLSQINIYYEWLSCLFVLPLFWLFAGWTVVQGMSLLGIVQPAKSKCARVIHISMLAIVVAYAAVMLPLLIEIIPVTVQQSQYDVNYSASSNMSYAIPVPGVTIPTLSFVYSNSAVFLLPGVLFRLSERAKRKKQSVAVTAQEPAGVCVLRLPRAEDGVGEFRALFVESVGAAGTLEEKVNGMKQTMAALSVTSTAFENGGSIPAKYTGYGEDVSPELRVEGLPSGTVSLAVTLDDLDVPGSRSFCHWLLVDIPAAERIPGNIPAGAFIPTLRGAAQGIAYGRNCYRGPKPPAFIKTPHRYVFTVYALDGYLGLDGNATKDDFLKAANGHILAQGSLLCTYQNKAD